VPGHSRRWCGYTLRGRGIDVPAFSPGGFEAPHPRRLASTPPFTRRGALGSERRQRLEVVDDKLVASDLPAE